MPDSLGRFRIVAILEGISYLVLVGIGMPLKYGLGEPMVVDVVGWIHGILFILYLIAGVQAAADEKWSAKFMVAAFVAALVPGGTFVLDRHLREGEVAEA